MKETIVNTMTNAPTYSLSQIAAALKTSNDLMRKRLAKAGIKPVAEYKTDSGRRFDFYDQNTMDTVVSWRAAIVARKAALEAKKQAKVERAKVKTLRASARLTPAPVATAPAAGIDALAEKVDLLITAVELLTRRVDSVINRALMSQQNTVADQWPIICDVLGVKDDVHA